MRALLQQAGQLVAAWFSRDRVRVSPTTGRLLGLAPGDRLLLLCDLYQIAERIVIGGRVVYRLQGADADAELIVQVPEDANALQASPTKGVLRLAGQERMVWDDDVVVLKDDRAGSFV